MSKNSFASRALRVAAASGIVLGALVPAGAAFAADYPSGTTGATGDPGSQVKASTTSNSNASTLPFTGGDVAGLAAIGAGAAVAGVVMVRHGKKKTATA